MKKNYATRTADQDFLPFAMVAQGLIVVLFACLSYVRQEMSSVIFYIALGGAIMISFVIYKVFESKYFANLLLILTLTSGFVYATVVILDPPSLMWCLTALPVLIGVCHYPRNLYLFVGLLSAAALVLFQQASLDHANSFSTSTTIQFLFVAAAIGIIAFNASNFRDKYLAKMEDLTSLVKKTEAEDSLTGLNTRRYVEAHLREKFSDQSMNVMATRLGDTVLCSLSDLFKTILADDYVFGRWDGNAFIIIIPHGDAEATLLIAEVLREKVSRAKLKAQGEILKLSCSLGIASNAKCSDSDDLLSHTENSLYQAKHMGGNTVIVS
jgi:GGDEF domain-containing protein